MFYNKKSEIILVKLYKYIVIYKYATNAIQQRKFKMFSWLIHVVLIFVCIGGSNALRYDCDHRLYPSSNLWYDTHKNKNKIFLVSFCIVFAQSIEGKPDVQSRMKMQLEQHRQAMLQLNLSDQQFYSLRRCVLY